MFLFSVGDLYWINLNPRQAALHHTPRKNSHAARILHVTSSLVQWEWLYHPGSTVTRSLELLIALGPLSVAAEQRPFVHVDTTYMLRDLDLLLAAGASPEDTSVLSFSP